MQKGKNMKINKLGSGVFTIEDFLTKDESNRYIEMSEAIGYEIATIQAISGPEINKEIRNNDRIIHDSPELAEFLFQKAKQNLPQVMDGWWLKNFNERFRFYRYSGEQYFKWHYDGYYSRNTNEESWLTFIIYLNDDFDEGYTQFPWEKIYPKAGMALVFPHKIRHRAVPALNGTKYVLRTDVMYQKNA